METEKQRRTIGLYCVNPNDSEENCHGWIVQNLEKYKIHLLSRYSEQGNGEGRFTAQLSLPLQDQGCIEITDLLIYTISTDRRILGADGCRGGLTRSVWQIFNPRQTQWLVANPQEVLPLPKFA
jgi:hypothetical protein